MTDTKEIIEVLNKSGVLLYPSDTLWGLGCDATNADAIDKIYKIKKRDHNKSMIILIDNINMVYSYTENPPDVALDMMEMSAEPLTIVFEKAKNLPLNLIAKDNSIAIRLVNDDFCKNLIRRLHKPIVSTSANFSGKETPLGFSDIDKELIEKVDFVVDIKHDVKRYKKASSIIKISNNSEIEILRK